MVSLIRLVSVKKSHAVLRS